MSKKIVIISRAWQQFILVFHPEIFLNKNKDGLFSWLDLDNLFCRVKSPFNFLSKSEAIFPNFFGHHYQSNRVLFNMLLECFPRYILWKNIKGKLAFYRPPNIRELLWSYKINGRISLRTSLIHCFYHNVCLSVCQSIYLVIWANSTGLKHTNSTERIDMKINI